MRPKIYSRTLCHGFCGYNKDNLHLCEDKVRRILGGLIPSKIKVRWSKSRFDGSIKAIATDFSCRFKTEAIGFIILSYGVALLLKKTIGTGGFYFRIDPIKKARVK